MILCIPDRAVVELVFLHHPTILDQCHDTHLLDTVVVAAAADPLQVVQLVVVLGLD